MADESNSEKEFDPTARRLEKAREQGDVPRSQETGAALALVIITMMITYAPQTIGGPLVEMVHRVYSIDTLHRMQAGASLAPLIIPLILKALLPLLAALAIGGLILSLAEMGFTLPSGDEAGFKFDFTRLDPVANLKNRFGLRVILDGLKNVLKLFLVSAALVYSAFDIVPRTMGLMDMTPIGLATALGHNIGQTLYRITAVAVVIAILDVALQRVQFTRKMRMSKQDLKDEMKQSEGDPHIKGARKKRQRELATKKSIATVPQATVLVANPTHFSVTLRYERGSDSAPIVLGKGRDRVALRMREIARENGIPIVENKPLARALFAVAKEGQTIPVDFFRSVAEVLAYVLAPPGSRVRPPAPAEIPKSAEAAVHRLMQRENERREV